MAIKPIEKKQVDYICPICNYSFKKKNLAERHIETCRQKKEEQEEQTKKFSNFCSYVRLSAKSVSDIGPCIEKAIFDYTGLHCSIEVNPMYFFHMEASSLLAPISTTVIGHLEPSEKKFLGFEGKIVYTLTKEQFAAYNKYKRNYKSLLNTYSLCDFTNPMQGIHTRATSFASSTSGSFKASSLFKIFIDDFPLIKAEYDKYLELNKKAELYRDYCETIRVSAKKHIKLDEQYIALVKELKSLSVEQRAKQREVKAKHEELFATYMTVNCKKPDYDVKACMKLKTQFMNFNSLKVN